MDDLASLKNQWVHFKLRDVYIPPAREILEQLHGDELLKGRVVGFTQKGATEETYVVAEVDGVRNAVVVPFARIVRVV